MSNIDRFDSLVGKIFAELYENFPVPMNISDEMFLAELIPAEKGTEEYSDLADGRSEFFESTVDWLVRAGYVYSVIRNEIPSDSFMGACLTPKTLECLKGLPANLGGDTIGRQLSAAAKNSATDIVRDLASQALSRGAALAAGAFNHFG